MRRPAQSLATLLAAALLAACAGMDLPGAGEPARSEARRAVISAASAQIGAPYRYRGADRKGFDDAGLVHFAFEEAGFDLPRDREAQLRAGRPIRFAEARPGDLLFHRVERTRNGRELAILHVGLYIGDGSMLHASLDRDEVVLETVDNAYWFQRRVAVIQVLP